MHRTAPDPAGIRAAWQGRVSGCLLGKPVEVLSFRAGLAGLRGYLQAAGALPLRDYVPRLDSDEGRALPPGCCRGELVRAEPDDDINYTVLALLLLERHGTALCTADVARSWLRLLPAGTTWTAERAAYRKLLEHMDDEFVNGADAGFDLAICADNPCNDWIGAQIRADLYGWVSPGRPELAAGLAARDAALSHRGEGVNGAVFVAALAASIPASGSLAEAFAAALAQLPAASDAAAAVRRGLALAGRDDAPEQLHAEFAGLPPVHTLNNLAVVAWALATAGEDFCAAIGYAVAAGWDTDSNGATVGGLAGLRSRSVPETWTRPWRGRVGVDLAGMADLELADLAGRTVAVAEQLQ